MCIFILKFMQHYTAVSFNDFCRALAEVGGSVIPTVGRKLRMCYWFLNSAGIFI